MLDKIKLTLLYLFYIVRYNPFKVSYILIMIVSYQYAGTYPDVYIEQYIHSTIEVDGKYLYVYSESNDNKIQYKLIELDTKQKLIDNKLTIRSYNDTNVFLYIIFGSATILLIVTLIVSINDLKCRWNFQECFRKSLKIFIKCEEENDIYHYTIFNRLIHKSTKIEHDIRCIHICSLSDLNTYPKFQTKRNKRKEALESLNI